MEKVPHKEWLGSRVFFGGSFEAKILTKMSAAIKKNRHKLFFHHFTKSLFITHSLQKWSHPRLPPPHSRGTTARPRGGEGGVDETIFEDYGL